MNQLTIKEIHLLIDQGLNSLGLFTEQALLHEQVDFVVNHIVEKHINTLTDILSNKRSNIEKAIIRFLTRRLELPVKKESKYYEAELPSDFGKYSTSQTILGLCGCETQCCHKESSQTCKKCSETDHNDIEEGQWYIATTAVKYDNQWLKPNDVFRGKDVSNIYGTYEKVKVIEKPNILSEIDALEAYTTNSLVKNSFRPLLAYDENKFYIYYDSCKKNKEILLGLFVNYIANYSDSLKISWCDNRTLGFPSEIQRFYIDKAIAYIAVINKQEQQNIVNLKQETI